MKREIGGSGLRRRSQAGLRKPGRTFPINGSRRIPALRDRTAFANHPEKRRPFQLKFGVAFQRREGSATHRAAVARTEESALSNLERRKRATGSMERHGDFVALAPQQDGSVCQGIRAPQIPLTTTRSGFYESLEVADVLHLLRLLDNPLQDLPLLAILRSPFVGLSLDEFAGNSPRKSQRPVLDGVASLA